MTTYQIESLRLCVVAIDAHGVRAVHEISAIINIPEALSETMRAAGAGFRPYVTAWFDNSSDLPRGDEDLRETIASALRRESLRLFREALDARADARSDD